MPDEEKIPLHLLEEALAETLAAAPNGAFALDDVLKRLDPALSATDRERLERLLDAEESLFSTEDGHYRSRSGFFEGGVLTVTPDAWEIEQGILLPGHRFAPVVSPDVFPSEVTLLEKGASEPLKMREIEEDIERIFPYHLLLGAEQLTDFLAAEHPENRTASGEPAQMVKLEVFDLADFYREHHFEAGDALECRLKSWRDGVFEFVFRDGADRPESAVRNWCDALTEGIRRTIGRFENYLEMTDQLAWAFFLNDGILLKSGGGSFDEFAVRSEGLQIRFDAGYSSFALEEDDPDGGESAGVPDGVSVSRGTTGDPSRLLAEIGCPLTEVEIDSYILDAAYARELDYEEFYARAFGRDLLKFADEGQEAAFRNSVEARWEDLTEHYDRENDAPKAELRTQILEVLDARNEFLDLLRGGDASELDTDALRSLAEISARLDALLKLLNAEDHTLQAGEAESLSEAVGSLGDEQTDLFDKIQCNPKGRKNHE